MELYLIVDGKAVSSNPGGFDVVCSRLCKSLPVDISYGVFSLMTCVEVLPRDLARYRYPALSVKINRSAYGHTLLFKDVATNGSLPLVLSDEFIASITKITQAKRCQDSKLCGNCSRFSRCTIGG